MCLCCMIHCDGTCDLQPGRVVKNGKSCYAGHCNTSIECMSTLSDDEQIQATIEFNKRRSENTNMHAIMSDVLQHDEDKILVWYGVRCNGCDNSMTSESGYFYHGSNDRDYCTACYMYQTDNRIYEKWSNLTCPYGGPNAQRISRFIILGQYCGGW